MQHSHTELDCLVENHYGKVTEDEKQGFKKITAGYLVTTDSGGRCETGITASCPPAFAGTELLGPMKAQSCLFHVLPHLFNYPRRNYITIRNHDTFRLLTPLCAYITANTKIMIRYWNYKKEFEVLAAVLCSVPCQTPVTARFLYLHKMLPEQTTVIKVCVASSVAG